MYRSRTTADIIPIQSAPYILYATEPENSSTKFWILNNRCFYIYEGPPLGPSFLNNEDFKANKIYSLVRPKVNIFYGIFFTICRSIFDAGHSNKSAYISAINPPV
jgi:hypothetical protein